MVGPGYSVAIPFPLNFFKSLIIQQVFNDPGYFPNENPQTHQCLFTEFKFFRLCDGNQTITLSFYLI